MSGEPSNAPANDTAELFPALEKLTRSRLGKKIPFIQQLEASDCGAACLAMVLGHLGHETTLEQVREAVGASGRDGADAQSLVRASEWYGLRGRGLSLDVEAFRFIPAGTILHWEFNHFVVFQRLTKHGIEIVDPAMGPRLVPIKKFSESFTGVALVFEAGDAFQKKKRGKGRFGWYFRQLVGQRHVLIRVVFMSLLLRIFALAGPLATALVVDRILPRTDRGLLTVLAVGLAGLVVFQMLTTLVRSHLLLQLRTNLDTRLTLGFVDYLAHLPFQFFQRRSTGDLMMRVNNNARVRELLTANTLSAMIDGLFVIGYGGLLFALVPLMGAVVLGLAALQIAVFFLTQRSYQRMMARGLEAQSRQQAYLVELLGGMETLKTSAAESHAVERWSNLYIDELNVSLERGRLDAMVSATYEGLLSGSPLVVGVFSALQVMSGSISLGEMLAINALAMGLLWPLSSMVGSAISLQMLGSYVDRMDDVLKAEPEQKADVSRAPKITGRITLQNVSFRYGDALPYVVRDVSLDIKSGMTVAFVGRSGCGKSTLARMISGLYPPTEGRLLYDGHDGQTLELKSLRRQIGVVSQSPSLFAGSLRNAIALGQPTAPFDKIVEAAQMAVIHDDIMAMPMRYDTLLSDGGQSLSGGQRQRIAIARALLHKPMVLVLDEATSALDSETERKVIKNLELLKCTRIVLAHRLSTIANADMIVVMDAGEVVETGTHDELLVRAGIYSRLVAAQLATGSDTLEEA